MHLVLHVISIELVLHTSDMSSLPLDLHNRITLDGQTDPRSRAISQTGSFGEASLLLYPFGPPPRPDAFPEAPRVTTTLESGASHRTLISRIYSIH